MWSSSWMTDGVTHSRRLLVLSASFPIKSCQQPRVSDWTVNLSWRKHRVWIVSGGFSRWCMLTARCRPLPLSRSLITWFKLWSGLEAQAPHPFSPVSPHGFRQYQETSQSTSSACSQSPLAVVPSLSSLCLACSLSLPLSFSVSFRFCLRATKNGV